MLSERKITSLHVYIHKPESKTSLGSNGRILMSTIAKYQGQHGGARIPLVGLFYVIKKSSKVTHLRDLEASLGQYCWEWPLQYLARTVCPSVHDEDRKRPLQTLRLASSARPSHPIPTRDADYELRHLAWSHTQLVWKGSLTFFFAFFTLPGPGGEPFPILFPAWGFWDRSAEKAKICPAWSTDSVLLPQKLLPSNPFL